MITQWTTSFCKPQNNHTTFKVRGRPNKTPAKWALRALHALTVWDQGTLHKLFSCLVGNLQIAHLVYTGIRTKLSRVVGKSVVEIALGRVPRWLAKIFRGDDSSDVIHFCAIASQVETEGSEVSEPPIVPIYYCIIPRCDCFTAGVSNAVWKIFDACPDACNSTNHNKSQSCEATTHRWAVECTIAATNCIERHWPGEIGDNLVVNTPGVRGRFSDRPDISSRS